MLALQALVCVLAPVFPLVTELGHEPLHEAGTWLENDAGLDAVVA